MAEPTLGARILDAAADCDSAGEYGIIGAEDRLRAIADRATAAERLAVAVDTAAGDREVNDWSYDARRLDEYNNALAAWRAMGEVQP